MPSTNKNEWGLSQSSFESMVEKALNELPEPMCFILLEKILDKNTVTMTPEMALSALRKGHNTYLKFTTWPTNISENEKKELYKAFHNNIDPERNAGKRERKEDNMFTYFFNQMRESIGPPQADIIANMMLDAQKAGMPFLQRNIKEKPIKFLKNELDKACQVLMNIKLQNSWESFNKANLDASGLQRNFLSIVGELYDALEKKESGLQGLYELTQSFKKQLNEQQITAFDRIDRDFITERMGGMEESRTSQNREHFIQEQWISQAFQTANGIGLKFLCDNFSVDLSDLDYEDVLGDESKMISLSYQVKAFQEKYERSLAAGDAEEVSLSLKEMLHKAAYQLLEMSSFTDKMPGEAHSEELFTYVSSELLKSVQAFDANMSNFISEVEKLSCHKPKVVGKFCEKIRDYSLPLTYQAIKKFRGEDSAPLFKKVLLFASLPEMTQQNPGWKLIANGDFENQKAAQADQSPQPVMNAELGHAASEPVTSSAPPKPAAAVKRSFPWFQRPQEDMDEEREQEKKAKEKQQQRSRGLHS